MHVEGTTGGGGGIDGSCVGDDGCDDSGCGVDRDNDDANGVGGDDDGSEDGMRWVVMIISFLLTLLAWMMAVVQWWYS